jgi:hypothetical protein
MHPLIRTARFAGVTMSALALTACASINVNSYSERGVDFAHYRSYDWSPPEQRSTGDPRLDNNPFFHERIRLAVERQLTRRGFFKASSGRPDLEIHYHANVTQEIDVNGADRQAGYCGEGDCQPYVYEAGTLLFDLVDTSTKRVVWRGWAEGSIDGAVNNQEWFEQKIDEVVARIFEQCPRRS